MKPAFAVMIVVLLSAIALVATRMPAGGGTLAASDHGYGGYQYSQAGCPTCEVLCPDCPTCEARVEYKYVTVPQYVNVTNTVYVNVTRYVCANGTIVNDSQACLQNTTNITTEKVIINYGTNCLMIYNLFDYTEQDEAGVRYRITGNVRNNCWRWCELVMIHFRLFDKNGRLMKDDFAFPSPSALPSGAEGIFSKHWHFISNGTTPQDIYEKPTRIELYATD